MRVLRIYHSAVVTAWRQREAALRDESIEVTTIAPARWNEGGAIVALETARDEAVICVPTIGHHPFRFLYRPFPLWRALRRNRAVEVLDVHEEPAALATIEVLLLARLAGLRAPLVCYSAQNIAKRYPPPFRWFERWILNRVAAVHSCNDDVARILKAKGFTGDVVNLGLGVDLDHFSPVAQADDRASGPFRVGYVGRFTEQKGIFTLLTAISLLADVECTFVGAGPDGERLQNAITVRNLDDRVRIEGFADHDELPATYRRFDVVAVPSIDQPSWREQFGRVPVEAMACGTPVVASDGGSLPEVVADAGIVMPQDDAEALAKALASLRDSPELCEELSRRGVRRANHFSWQRIARDQAVVYRAATR